MKRSTVLIIAVTTIALPSAAYALSVYLPDQSRIVGQFVYDFQTLITGIIALAGAALVLEQIREARKQRQLLVLLHYDGQLRANEYARKTVLHQMDDLRKHPSGQWIAIADQTVNIVKAGASPLILECFQLFAASWNRFIKLDEQQRALALADLEESAKMVFDNTESLKLNFYALANLR